MPHPEEVYTLEACGQTWRLFCNNRALRSMERELGCSVAEAGHGFLSVSVMLWGLLLHFQPTATLATVDKILDDIGFTEVIEPVTKAVVNSRPFRGLTGREQDTTGSSAGETPTSSGT